jgi:hypothetical protein
LVDRAGNVFDTMAASTVVLDLHAPTLPIVETTPKDYSRDPSNVVLTMLGESQDNIDTSLRYEYQIDPPPSGWGNEPWLPAELGQDDELTGIVALDPCLAECGYRRYIYKLRAVDRAGNIGDPATAQLVLDQTPPEHPLAAVVKIDKDAYDSTPFFCDTQRLEDREEWRCKITNSDVTTVWISLDSSITDPNFIQFLVSTDGGNSWHETGVGIGGIQIPVVLDQNRVNEVWVCGRDLAGNESCHDADGIPVALPDQSKVTYIEDSAPPTAPSLYPEEGEVNADRVTLLIHTASTDTVGLKGYEFSVNGSPFQELSEDATMFEVDLKRDFENVIQIHAVDDADNHSGTGGGQRPGKHLGGGVVGRYGQHGGERHRHRLHRSEDRGELLARGGSLQPHLPQGWLVGHERIPGTGLRGSARSDGRTGQRSAVPVLPGRLYRRTRVRGCRHGERVHAGYRRVVRRPARLSLDSAHARLVFTRAPVDE